MTMATLSDLAKERKLNRKTLAKRLREDNIIGKQQIIAGRTTNVFTPEEIDMMDESLKKKPIRDSRGRPRDNERG